MFLFHYKTRRERIKELGVGSQFNMKCCFPWWYRPVSVEFSVCLLTEWKTKSIPDKKMNTNKITIMNRNTVDHWAETWTTQWHSPNRWNDKGGSEPSTKPHLSQSLVQSLQNWFQIHLLGQYGNIIPDFGFNLPVESWSELSNNSCQCFWGGYICQTGQNLMCENTNWSSSKAAKNIYVWIKLHFHNR